jgi:RNA polymerase sigma-70 factor, ECF subfamily
VSGVEHEQQAREQLAREEADLVARIAAGDHGLPVAELYNRYAGRLYGFGLQLLRDPGLAEEVVQETFVRLWRTAGRFDPARGSVGAYLFVMARSVAADVRKRPSSRILAGAEDVDPPPVEDDVDRLMEGLVVREALDSLAPTHREVLSLAYDKRMTQSEIAQQLAIPLGTVKTRMFHGLRALRAALQQRSFDV